MIVVPQCRSHVLIRFKHNYIIKRIVYIPPIRMTHCEICGKPVFYHNEKHRPRFCRRTKNMLPGTSCLSIGQNLGKDKKTRKYGLQKMKMRIPGYDFIGEPGEVPPIIRDSY